LQLPNQKSKALTPELLDPITSCVRLYIKYIYDNSNSETVETRMRILNMC